jgi:hypothetical protein
VSGPAAVPLARQANRLALAPPGAGLQSLPPRMPASWAPELARCRREGWNSGRDYRVESGQNYVEATPFTAGRPPL